MPLKVWEQGQAQSVRWRTYGDMWRWAWLDIEMLALPGKTPKGVEPVTLSNYRNMS